MTKPFLACVVVLTVMLGEGHVLAGAEVPMEERLASLQIEEVALKLRYRPQSPKLLDVQSQIKVLREIPEIQNARYYDYLSTLLPGLEEAREALARKQRPGNPALAEADARLAFVKKTLEERPVSPPETAGPPGSLGTP